MYSHTVFNEWTQAWTTWNNEFATMLTAIGCEHYYDFTRCDNDPETDNYAYYMQDPMIRQKF